MPAYKTPLYFIIPVDGFDAKTTMNSIIENTKAKERDIEILKSNDMVQALRVAESQGFPDNYAFVLTSQYLLTKDPFGIWKELEPKNPFLYNTDEKIFCIAMGHGKCRSHFTRKTPDEHLKTYLNFSLSSAHIYRESKSFDEFFHKRGSEVKKRFAGESKLDREGLESLKQAREAAKEKPKKK